MNAFPETSNMVPVTIVEKLMDHYQLYKEHIDYELRKRENLQAELNSMKKAAFEQKIADLQQQIAKLENENRKLEAGQKRTITVKEDQKRQRETEEE